MANLITPVDVPSIVKDFQKIVVDLKESEKVNRSLSYAHRIANRHIPGQNPEEHKKNRNRQLRDLDNENRQLRQLYEDSQWTLHLVMESHRRLMEETFDQDDGLDLSQDASDDELEDRKQDLHVLVAQMAHAVNGVYRYEEQMVNKLQKRIIELREENDILRCILDSESGADLDSIYQRFLGRSCGSLPKTDSELDTHSSDDTDSSAQLEEQPTPRKKQSVIENPKFM
ncbi:hypothetical protein Q1695_000963 [Nippostrongylus brasiliensis]|nr:hypothetical protein Q1695_000963 [Nippostrongylus brasiliensis]